MVIFWMVPTDVKKPSSIADKSRDNGTGQKGAGKEKKACFPCHGKTSTGRASLCPFKCHFTLFHDCIITSAISLGFFLFFFFFFSPLSGVKARIVEESTVERFCFVCVFRHSC